MRGLLRRLFRRPKPAPPPPPPAAYVATEGPWKGRLIVAGRAVPHIAASAREDGTYSLILDDRFGIIVGPGDLAPWGWLLAHAMAIAAGWTGFGEGEGRLYNPYGADAPLAGRYPGRGPDEREVGGR